ncbi:unnamed protein product [Adineta ricciae]|uniref:Uncharacterized protein n=1 Tax=Adineta ricciae TaxID=249248 RepID=A0A814IXC9_ADIRI|nr:unnamed protein product [Adineta ricciae]CAF1031756.1 unnamed protein product [Adineta ricciae]
MINNKFILIIISAIVGLIPIILGIVALATPKWIVVNLVDQEASSTYGLFQQCSSMEIGNGSITSCADIKSAFQTVQGLQIAGVVILTVGVVIAIIIKQFLPKYFLKLSTPLLPLIGSVLILVGSLLFAKYVIEHFSRNLIYVTIGYSMVLMVIACICGFVITVLFAFDAGYSYGNSRSTVNFG